jgi:hypothetical protein
LPKPKKWTSGFAKLYKEREKFEYMAQIVSIKENSKYRRKNKPSNI